MEAYKCLCCDSSFERSASDAARGRTKYCSFACYHQDKVGQPRSDRGRNTEERACPICGTHFWVGGRGHHKKATIFCGWKCSRLSRYRSGSVGETLSREDCIRVASLIDGEGCIFLYMRRDVVAIRLAITNTNFALLERVKTIAGIGAVIVRPGTASHKRSGQWVVNAEAAENILKQVRDHLWIKQEQCDLALETQARLRDPKLKADRSWQSAYHAKMQLLNKRGPTSC